VLLIERISKDKHGGGGEEDSRENMDDKRKIAKYFRTLYYMIRG
jgi:hypothetical protein